MIDLQAIPKYVVTIPRLVERHAHTVREFGKVGWQFEFVMGQDRLEYGAEYLEYVRTVCWPGTKKRDNYYAGRLACLASHRRAMQVIIERAHPLAMVCEDDLEIHPTAPLVDLSDVPEDFEMLYLAGFIDEHQRRQHYRGRLWTGDQFYGNQCYIIPQRIAIELETLFRPEVGGAVDWVTKAITSRQKSYMVIPTVVTNSLDLKSELRHRRFRRNNVLRWDYVAGDSGRYQ